ncbi:hypothetical protein HDU91_001057 [Kappamyces sp. JEL0680]|nr:hypothetical protein HDU91_001057 [Kappamyces sp. JEL0680]
MLESHPNCVIHSLKVRAVWLTQEPKRLSRLSGVSYLVKGIVRVVSQSLAILYIACLVVPLPDLMIIQNPPAIPTLALFQLTSFVRRVPLIIDWHNFGFSIMALDKPKSSMVVKLAMLYEIYLGSWASAHLTVTKAMGALLKQEWGVRGMVVTLYDRPPKHFKVLTAAERLYFLSHLDFKGREVEKTRSLPTSGTLFTSYDLSLKTSRLKTARHALLISSTSWTADEDFSILLDALELYDERAETRYDGIKKRKKHLPPICMVITGKGPLKDHYMAAARKKKLPYSSLYTAWMSMQDYPRLVGCADLGISLHTSSSGLDLPMKIVDLFGAGTLLALIAGVPCCALQFASIAELVKDGVNGRIFRDAHELADQLSELLEDLDGEASPLVSLRTGVQDWRDAGGWEENWDRNMIPLIRNL